MIARIHLLALVLLMIGAGAAHAASPVATPDATPAPACRVTIPNGSTPVPESGPGWHGNAHLWVGLPLDGVLRINPALIDDKGYLSDKMVWYRREIGAPLTVIGLLVTDPTVTATIEMIPYPQQTVQPIGITFPREGCWEITGTVPSGSLTVTFWVVKW